ncbi:MAG: hypothetical protein ACYDCC_12265 [Actinomycetota bacterium]
MKRIWIALAMAGTVVVIGAAAVSAGQRHAEPFRGTKHIVQPSETLWQIVERAYPNKDPRDEVQLVEDYNKLGSAAVSAGQRLLLPTPG